MIKLLTNTLPIVLVFFTGSLLAQKIYRTEKLKLTPEYLNGKSLVVCYQGGEIKQSIPFSKELRNIRARAKATPAIFDITYIGFDSDPEAKAAFQYAADIWSQLIESPQPIRVQAQFTPLDQGVLGSAIPSNFIRNFKNAPKFNTWFAIAVAEKIANKPFNDATEFDIETSFNSDAEWYYDTANPDSILGTGKTDFASVVMHELAHGLGFMGVSDVNASGEGTIGLANFPMIFTSFAETASGKNLVTSITNGSQTMGDALTGDNLKFVGPTFQARLHAPSTYARGSTLSHLDEGIYKNTPNELMTPSIGINGFIHDPGISLTLMQDYGWEFTYMLHDPLPNTEVFDQAFDILAVVTSDALLGFDTASLTLHYSTDEFVNMDSALTMNATGNLDEYMATIPNQGGEASLSYYLKVLDKKNRIFTNPGSIVINKVYETIPFHFTAALDDSIPTIEHTPIDFLLNTKTEEPISASIFDYFMGVDTAYVEYLINDVAQPSFGMSRDLQTFTIFEGIMNLPGTSLGDVVKYKIIAIDSAASQNMATDPPSGFHQFLIEEISDPITMYKNDFNSPSSDFLGDGFEIATPINFTDGAIHSLHPYEEAGAENEIQYIYQLKTPIIVDNVNTEVLFDEIVLVEPGETGTKFGDLQFWDFVVVEASKDFGVSWFEIFDGYDSRDQTIWLNRYTSSIDGNNSTAIGHPSLYLERRFDLLDNPSINSGDEILFRFRLFSDPFANGWGWAIDNLQIQVEIIVSVDDYLEEKELTIYPNPSASGIYTFNGLFKKQPENIQLQVLDLLGKSVYSARPATKGLVFNHELNLSDQPPGIYFINLLIDNERLTRKVVKSR